MHEETPRPKFPLQAPPPEVLVSSSSSEPVEALAAASTPCTPATENDLMQKREFLWKVHTYVNDSIRFGDTKAVFCVGIASALIGALFASKCHELFMGVAPSQWTALGFTSLSAFVLLAISIGAAVTVIRPRLWTHSEKSFVFWKAISKFDAPSTFTSEYEAQPEAALNAHLAHHLYSLAKICCRKYAWMNFAILAAAGGGALAVIVLLFKR